MTMAFDGPIPTAHPDAPPLPLPALGQYARRLLAQRRRRDQLLGADLFGEPIWDMCLDLFANAVEGRPVSISSLCIASGTSTTTALRHIAMLVDRGLLLRRQDASDGRRVLVELAPMLFEQLAHLLQSWRASGEE
ncbi:MarR family transcriptional regulator [Sphingobium sp. Sx8-8]|uniref:MarR family transcriptional regulator n=1 Tax=Sphingobium sp. Sx8-8 TaxID=2933617 RepID=UPI001F576D5A|nr:MarR family transcriptional regulator [Sphingobium sp. Sx8-8]